MTETHEEWKKKWKLIYFLHHTIELDSRFEKGTFGDETTIICPNCEKPHTESEIAEECYEYADNDPGNYELRIECPCGTKISIKYRYQRIPDIKIESITLENKAEEEKDIEEDDESGEYNPLEHGSEWPG
ncbi:MAG: hypothetical protein HXS54_01480 [Theionarchaea archaeon]|nr:hypothetical protein [Theionarchaea archaeon]